MAKIGVKKGKPLQKRGRKVPDTTNKAGGKAFSIKDPAEALLHRIGHMAGEPKFYKDDTDFESPVDLDSEVTSMVEAVAMILDTTHPEDALAIARWARDPKDGAKLRTTPILTLATCFEDPAGLSGSEGMRRFGGLARRYAPYILQRADEPRLLFAAWRHMFGGITNNLRSMTPPQALKRAVAAALRKVDENTLVKWKGTGRPSLGDVIRVCDASLLSDPKFMFFVDKERWEKSKPSERTPMLWARHKLAQKTKWDSEAEKLAKQAGVEWEMLVSQFGNSEEIWKAILPRMGYMALLRNLRNFAEAGMNLTHICERIGDPEEVQKGKQLPFRFLTAAGIFEPMYGMKVERPATVSPVVRKQVVEALEKAMDASVVNLPDLPGTTVVAVDLSGSMTHTMLSEESSMTPRLVACALAAMINAKCENTVVVAFADRAAVVRLSRRDSILTNSKKISECGIQGGTYAFKVFELLMQEGIRADRVILLSDMQCYGKSADERNGVGTNDTFERWAAQMHINPWFHSINLMGTEQSQVGSGTRVNLMSGFSEQIVRLMVGTEMGESVETRKAAPKSALVVPTIQEIRKVWYIKS